MDIIIGYFVAAIKAVLGLFGIAADEEFISNLESMFGGLKDFAPVTPEGSIDM